MKKAALLTILASALQLAVGVRTEAQPAAGKVPRIGYLNLSSLSAEAPFVEAFRDGLRQLGYVEGQNIIVEYRYAESKIERLPELILSGAWLLQMGVIALSTSSSSMTRIAIMKSLWRFDWNRSAG